MAEQSKPKQRRLSCVIKQPDGCLARQTISFPATWTVTFGPLTPGSRGDSTKALRIYGPKKNQYACFVNVQSFIDRDHVEVGSPEPLPEPPPRTPLRGVAAWSGEDL